ncbi:MAG TPA: 6-phospho-beta-glucosidase [Acidobacteriota bacterium]|nr:6-phospho-beta-glucosidase [Acidobacteriota bacterium]
MKITIIGGAGARVPLVTHGLIRFRQDLPVQELSLWDIDKDRRSVIARISRAMASRAGVSFNVSEPETLEEALENADFIISSIRVGGMRGRILDETVALKHGTVGQETVGAGGFCLALRTIPPLLEYLEQIAKMAPDAWVLNFTNPVGIVSQSMILSGLGSRVIGICDTPREQFEMLAHSLDVPLEEAYFDYFGLNHLGWIRGVEVDGRNLIKELLDSPEKLNQVYRIPLFEAEFLRDLGLFPTEYLYYYYRTRHACEHTAGGDRTRGQLIQNLEDRLMERVSRAGSATDEIAEAYDDYLAARNASYMTVETGEEVSRESLQKARRNLYTQAAGYDRIAIDAMRAISRDSSLVMPLDVANIGAIEELEDDDSVEVPCVIGANGPHPLATGKPPQQIRDLLFKVKRYERLTAQAALHRSAEMAEDALASNPLIDSREQARKVLEEYRQVHGRHLEYLS